MTTRLDRTTAELTRPGGALDLGPDKTPLVNRIFRLLAEGAPISSDDVRSAAAELGIDPDIADELVDSWAERDAAGHIVGMGVTYNPTPHRMRIDGADMWAWCAIDTLIFGILLDKEINVASDAPGGRGTTRIRVSRSGVSMVEPADAVITWPTRERDQIDISSTAAIWGTFCHHSFLFPSRAGAEQWAAGRQDIEILPLDDGFAIAQALASAWSRYE